MEKTLEVLLQEQKLELLTKIIKDFERRSHKEILSNEHSYNDCAIIAKMWMFAASEVRRYI